MASGGTFKLLANDGKADRLILATKLLNQRIKDIAARREQFGMADTQPSLPELEATHIIHMNAHFKPFVAIGSQYDKVKPGQGTPQLGNAISFSIPEYGDFFYDMVCRQTLCPFRSSEQKIPVRGKVTGSYGYPAVYPQDGLEWDNATAQGANKTITYSLVDFMGKDIPATQTTYRNLVRYCEYPGEKLYTNVKVGVNGNPLDEYYNDTVCMLRKFTISADKMIGYNRMCGQEVPLTGYGALNKCRAMDSQHQDVNIFEKNVNAPEVNATLTPVTPSVVLQEAFPSNMSVITDAEKHSYMSSEAPAYYDLMRKKIQGCNGPQTPKLWQPSLDIWNKLRFWFNDDVRLAIPAAALPYGDRNITVTMCKQEDLVSEEPGIYVKQVVRDLTPTSGTVDGVNTMVMYKPYFTTGTISDITLTNVELYVNNLFVNSEIHDIYVHRVGFTLIRVYRRHDCKTNSGGRDSKLLSQLKWPVEYMYIGLRPDWNNSKLNSNRHRDWHRFGKVVDMISSEAGSKFDFTMTGGAKPVDVNYQRDTVQPDTYSITLPTISTLSLTTHGIDLHTAFPEIFYHSYNTFQYGGSNIVTPEDRGVMMINFSLYPRTYQPSGHLNLSRTREVYLEWNTQYVSSNTPADLVVVAIAINFLLITDGSAILRYSA